MGPGREHNNGVHTAETSLYDLLEVAPEADLAELRRAYRRLARVFHPDVRQARADSPMAKGLEGGEGVGGHDFDEDWQLTMARINEAWFVLSDTDRRAEYDRARRQRPAGVGASTGPATASPAGNRPADTGAPGRGGRGPVTFVRPASPGGPRDVVVLTRKEAWLRGVGLRIRFLAGYAGRSAVQTMLLRHPGTSRQSWEALVPLICERLTVDVGERVRQARAAGAAPLDLANAATLLALHDYGEELVRMAHTPVEQRPVAWRKVADDELRGYAEMVDRIYEALAYELPRELVHHLGNAPRVLRRLPRR